jgi:hypothetical protein
MARRLQFPQTEPGMSDGRVAPSMRLQPVATSMAVGEEGLAGGWVNEAWAGDAHELLQCDCSRWQHQWR